MFNDECGNPRILVARQRKNVFVTYSPALVTCLQFGIDYQYLTMCFACSFFSSIPISFDKKGRPYQWQAYCFYKDKSDG